MLLSEYDNLLGESVDLDGDATDLMTMTGEGNISDIDSEVLEVLSGMDDDELVEETMIHPELMGRLFKRLRKRRKYRRKLLKKFKKMPRRKRRRIIRRMMLKRAALKLIPGSRLAKLVMLRRTSRAGKKRAARRRVARRKRWDARKSRRDKRISARRSRRQARRGKKRTSSKSYEVTPSQAYIAPSRQEMKRQRRGTADIQPGPEMEEMETMAPDKPKGGIAKFLPLVAAAAAIPFLLGNKKGK